ncbi:MAG: uracil-DNA glycosylase [bacterium]|nr:uracil-DNA glycosylase [bacterium]
MDTPYTLKNPNEQQRRRELLHIPKMLSLTKYVEELRRRNLGEVPDFDPLDGGVEAAVLFLMEKPGRQANSSGFVSRNNPDPTARAIFEFSEIAEVPREVSCLWNTIPGWNGTTKLTNEERDKGIACLRELFDILPKLKVVVLVGKQAQRAEKYICYVKGPDFPIIKSAHPSIKVKNINPDMWHQIPLDWEKAHRYL